MFASWVNRYRVVAGVTLGMLALTLLSCPTSAQTVLSGGSYVINTPQYSSGAVAENGASITLQNGGAIGSDSTFISLELDDTSTLNMQGGSIAGDSYGVAALGSGPITVSNGTISGFWGLEVQGSNTITLSGGVFSGSATPSGGMGLDALYGTGSSTTISGGTFTGHDSARFGSTSTGNISGGSFAGLYFGVDAEGSSVVDITGGSYSGSVAGLYTQDTGIINVYGSGLHFVGNTLVGTLQDGQSINTTYQILNSGQINLINAPVPEGNALPLVGCGLMYLGFRLRRQRA